jgi:ABC-type lipoprotein release transport system permease subunit
MVAAFSMACRNLRRRKTRTILSLTNIAILVFGFITFTSISPGYGLVTQPLRPSLPLDALLVRDEPVDSDNPFVPLPASFLPWLESQPNVTVISPKAENTPISFLAEPLDYLYSRAGASMMVYGILGVVPSLEANLTLLNRTVVEGDYLKDDDINEVLIASSLQERLEVAAGDKLYGFDQEFTIRGFFDRRALESLMDIDGRTIIPYWIDPDAGPTPCPGNVVIILLCEKALTLPRVAISRVTVQLENPEDYSPLAQIIALTREYRGYISHPGSLYLQSVRSYVEEKGAGLTPILMLIVMLNIAVSMLGSVRERGDEISSLSSVGLNPTHIATLFIAEAVVIGFVGGGAGYLSGVFGYRVASNTLFGALQVREKVSAEWGLVALLVSGCTAILASLIPALRASTIITPSLLRKWTLRQSVKPRDEGQPWMIDLPIKLMKV